MSSHVGIVGSGPRALVVLERLCANSLSLLGEEELNIHLIDPFPSSGGRIWRANQSPLLWMNSRAEDVTFFTDDSTKIEGPIFKGPTLWEWLRDIAPHLDIPESLRIEAARARSGTFISRVLGHEYLSWYLDKITAHYADRVNIVFHRARAIDLTTENDREVITLDNKEKVIVDVVLLAQGHLDVEPSVQELENLAIAKANGLTYIPKAHTADLDLGEILPGENVLVRGFGLAFIDLIVLLTEGRGGRYVEREGELIYIPSGKEPKVFVGSPRGVPYRSKIGYSTDAPAPQIPRYLNIDAIKSQLSGPIVTNFDEQVWPLIAKDLAYAHYAELFRANPERTNISWKEFESRYDTLHWYSNELRSLEETALKDPRDILNFEKLDKPLDGLKFESFEQLQNHLRAHISSDYLRRHDSSFSSDSAVFWALLLIFGGLAPIIQSGLLSPRTIIEEIEGRFFGFFSYVASGPPGPRLKQLLALSNAGVLVFVGGDAKFGYSPSLKKFVATSANHDHEISARALIEARIPEPNIDATVDPLIVNLRSRGEVGQDWSEDSQGLFTSGKLVVHPLNQRLAQSDGTFARKRFAAGPWVKGGLASSGFARQGTNAFGFKYNDNLAREILKELVLSKVVSR